MVAGQKGIAGGLAGAIADSIETVLGCGGCDKNIPGAMIAIEWHVRLNPSRQSLFLTHTSAYGMDEEIVWDAS